MVTISVSLGCKSLRQVFGDYAVLHSQDDPIKVLAKQAGKLKGYFVKKREIIKQALGTLRCTDTERNVLELLKSDEEILIPFDECTEHHGHFCES